MRLLKEHEKLKDDDQYLLAMIWKEELEGMPQDSNRALLGMIARHELTHFESVRRTRQKVQEEFPELRGLNYKKRQQYTETVKKEIKEITPQQRLL